VLCVDAVSRRYDSAGVQALDRISFVAQAGEVIALTGPSGCGKSTLLSILGLLDRPDGGRVSINGMELGAIRRPSEFRARHLGFVFQFHHMVSTMTLLENVAAPMIALGVPRAERRQRAGQMLERVGLAARADFLPSNVSGGERQRAAVARALVNHPSIILADEPTGNLDSRNGRVVIDLLLEHARASGALAIVATHNPEVAASASRRIELLDGRTVDQAPAAAAASPLNLEFA
jgi:ABC-type lipoprotein export system ATPase subunit